MKTQILKTIAALGLFGAFAQGAMAYWTTQIHPVTCSSVDKALTYCHVGGETLIEIAMVNKLSSAECKGRQTSKTYPGAVDFDGSALSYGYYDNVIWVDHGCRADFQASVSVWIEDTPPIYPPNPPSYCTSNSVDGTVAFYAKDRDMYGRARIEVVAPKAYVWVMASSNDAHHTASPSDVYCENGSQGPCHWTFAIAGYESYTPVSFIINAVNDQWWLGQKLASCVIPKQL